MTNYMRHLKISILKISVLKEKLFKFLSLILKINSYVLSKRSLSFGLQVISFY